MPEDGPLEWQAKEKGDERVVTGEHEDEEEWNRSDQSGSRRVLQCKRRCNNWFINEDFGVFLPCICADLAMHL